jgi:hypothetical protein
MCLSGFAQKMAVPPKKSVSLASPRKLGSAAGCTARPKRTEAGRKAFSVRGPTQTDRFGRFGCLKWVGPLEMPLVVYAVTSRFCPGRSCRC